MAFLKLKPAALELGVKYFWLREQAAAGTIPAIRTSPTGTWLVDVQQVKEALQNRTA